MRSVIAASLLVIIPGIAWAQSAKAAATGSRTAWGTPDLQGIWDFRTITPLERPSALAEKQVLTNEEAAAFEEQENRRLNRDLVDPKKGGAIYPPESEAALFPTTSFGTTEEQHSARTSAPRSLWIRRMGECRR